MLLAAPLQTSGRVVLVGVDGGSWNLIDAGIADGDLPTFAALAGSGVTGRLATVEPVISPTVWTSIATGRTPDAHGIRGFYATGLFVKVPTAWERLAARGVRVGTYDYLMTWPPLALPGGFAIPGWLREDASIEPPDAFARAGIDPYTYSNSDLRGSDDVIETIRDELARKADRFVALLDTFDPEVAAVTYYSLDASSHRFWRDSFPGEFDGEMAGRDPDYARVIPEALVGIDGALARIRAALRPEDTLLVASDHGFHAADDVRNVWVTRVHDWLASADLDPTTARFTVNDGFALVAARVHPGPFAERERSLERLRAWLASARMPDGAPLYQVYTVDVAERPPGHARPWGERIRQLAVRAYLWWIGRTSDLPAHAWVFAMPNRELLDTLASDTSVLVGEESWPLSALAHADEFSGTHDPTAIFLAAGHGISARGERVDLSVLDLAPLLFYLSGQPVPDDLDGELPLEVIDPQHLTTHPLQTIAAERIPTPKRAPSAEQSPEERAALTERLRALGYVE